MKWQLFTGTGYKDDHPKKLEVKNFHEWVTTWLSSPVVCHLEAAAYAALPPTQQKEAKNTGYFCAAAFGGDGRRCNANITSCHLVVLDIDDAESAQALLEAPLEDLIPWNFALWTTLTSTPEKPRVRLVVESVPLTRSQYKAAVSHLAARLGVEKFDPVSTDTAHLWYRPTVFADRATQTPMVASRTTGHAFAPLEEEVEDTTGDALPVPQVTDVTLEDVKTMLSLLDPDDPPYWGWVTPLMALRHQFGDSEDAFQLFDQWSTTGAKYAGTAESRKKWKAFRVAPKSSDPVTIRTLIKDARAKGWTPQGHASMSALEARINAATNLTDLLGPVLKAIHDSVMLSSLEVDALLGVLRNRAKVFNTSLKLTAVKNAYKAFDAGSAAGSNGVVPAALQGYVYVREPNLWIHPARGTRMPPAAFDLGFAASLDDDVGRPSIYALRNLALPVVDREVYDPRRPTELIYTEDSGREVLNTYRRSYPEIDPDRAPEAAEILEEHLALLFPDPRSRALLRSWMGWTLRNPGEKAKWHIFVQGAPGCGKSLLAEALAVTHGPTNSRKVSPQMIVEKFNLWVQGCCFAYFEEVLVGERQRDTMESLKDLVTGETVNIRAMRSDAVERPNHLNGLFLSNHTHGLRLEQADRRFFCLCCAQQTESDVRAIPREYFVRLARLKGDLAGALRYYLLTVPLDNEFDPNGHAPHTLDRDIVMIAGASEIYCAITQAIEEDTHALISPEVVASGVLYSIVRSEAGGRGVTPKQVSRALTEMGFKKQGQRLLSDGERHTLWYHPERLKSGVCPTHAINARLAAKEIE